MERSPNLTASDVRLFLNPPSFMDYSRQWLAAKIDRTISNKPIAQSTAQGYGRNIEGHLIPFFGGYQLKKINEELCQRLKAEKLRTAAEQLAAIDAGAMISNERGRRISHWEPHRSTS